MFSLKSVLLIAASVVGGIYITSEEGKKARKVLEKRKSVFKPIVDDLLQKSKKILDGSETIDSDEVKANIEYLTSEAKNTLLSINLDDAIETIREAIKVSSKKIREAFSELEDTKSKKGNGK